MIHKTEYADDLAEDCDVIRINRFHGIIFRLQTDSVLFLEKGLHGRAVFE